LRDEPTNLAYWFPKLEAAGVPVPRTILVHTDADLAYLLDGQEPPGYADFHAALKAAVEEIGTPCFLRTGYISGKHEWERTCYLDFPEDMWWHVQALVEESALVDIMGLPTNDWAVRELIKTAPLFRCRRYANFPVTREFRVFIRDDEIEHVQPYWPPDAVEEGKPDRDDWRELLAAAANEEDIEKDGFGPYTLAGWACGAVGGGYWSVDCLQDRDGKWWVTDMAEGDRSFRYEPAAAAA
jgi:hypothetical protein